MDIIPNVLSSVATILFPIFASYKALRTSDPAQLTPWLMYWVVLSCFSLFDYWTYFVLSWLPFYSVLRLVVLLYLVLPQTQGARVLYQGYVHPFIAHHEYEIEAFISTAHDRAISLGLSYVKQAIRFVTENILGLQSQQQQQQYQQQGGYFYRSVSGSGGGASRSPGGRTTPSSERNNYAQSLLSRFNLPNARQGLAAPAGDFYSLLSSAVVGTLNPGTTREAQVENLSRSGTLIPQGMTTTAEKMSFLSTQRERLRVLLSALDKEASDLGTEAAIERDVDQRMLGAQLGEGLRKSRSEAEFEEIGREDVVTGAGTGGGRGADRSSWLPWGWGGAAKENTRGSASGVDTGRQ